MSLSDLLLTCDYAQARAILRRYPEASYTFRATEAGSYFHQILPLGRPRA